MMTDEQRQRQKEASKRWRDANPEKDRERRAKYQRESRARRKAEDPEGVRALYREMNRKARAKWTPEQKLRYRAKEAAANRLRRAEASEEKKQRARDCSARYRERNRAALRECNARYRERNRAGRRDLPAGVVENAAASPGRDMLARLIQAAPRCEDRDDVIAEAALLVLEGMPETAALKQAQRIVQRSASFLRYGTCPIQFIWTL